MGSKKKKGIVFCEKIGRPPLLDDNNINELAMKMAETSYKKTDKNYANLLHQQMLINAQQHNKSTASISSAKRY